MLKSSPSLGLLALIVVFGAVSGALCPKYQYVKSETLTGVKQVYVDNQQVVYVTQSSKVNYPTLVVSKDTTFSSPISEAQAIPPGSKGELKFGDGDASNCIEVQFPEGYDALETLFVNGNGKLILGNFTGSDITLRCDGQGNITAVQPITFDEISLNGNGNCVINTKYIDSIAAALNVTIDGQAQILFAGEASEVYVKGNGNSEAVFGVIEKKLLSSLDGQATVLAFGSPTLVATGELSGNSGVTIQEGKCNTKPSNQCAVKKI